VAQQELEAAMAGIVVAEHAFAADGRLRRPPLNDSVDMTSDVKSWEGLFLKFQYKRRP
jgi:hypothetical protein